MKNFFIFSNMILSFWLSILSPLIKKCKNKVF
nr:MAG TPA: hypothetical protein [Caudoviricetes sp.]